MTVQEFQDASKQVQDELVIMWAKMEFSSVQEFAGIVDHARECEKCSSKMREHFTIFLRCNVDATYASMEDIEKHLWN